YFVSVFPWSTTSGESMPETLKGIQHKIQALMLRAEKLKERNKLPAIKQIDRLMRKHDLTLNDLRKALVKKEPTKREAGKRKVSKVRPMYRNPATGDTWSGRGRPARWL